MEALNSAFRSPQGWAAFKSSVWAKQAHTIAWVAANDAAVSAQAAARHLLPEHDSTAALDAHLGRVRDMLDSRSLVLRNARRTTTMLGLVRLHLHGSDDTRRYTTVLRDWLDAREGTAPHSGAGTTRERGGDSKLTSSWRVRYGGEFRPLPGPHRTATVSRAVARSHAGRRRWSAWPELR